MKNRDIISSLFWMALGLGVCYGGYKLEIGTLNDPGSGFMFFWLGIIMLGLAISILVKALKQTAVTGELKKVFWTDIRLSKIIAVLIALVLYAYFYLFLGFLLSTLILMIFLFKVVEPQTWLKAVLGAILATGSAYVIFYLWLGSQLPKGLLGIG
ncbi:MAG: tripartite tricarboxylate transporter TctB family protein [Thermodesulfobacteriota bacterium]